MTNPTSHGQVPDTLIDLIDAYAETRHRCGGIYNARTEAARKAVIEDLREALGGVQALSAASPPADQQAAQVIINFPQVGTAGPFPVVDGRVSLPDSTMQDLVRMLRPTYEAEQQAQPDECFPGEPKVAVPQGLIGAACFAIRNKRDGGKVLEQLRRYSVGDRSQPLAPQPASPKTAPGVGNSGFDHKTAADFLNGKTISDEAAARKLASDGTLRPHGIDSHGNYVFALSAKGQKQ